MGSLAGLIIDLQRERADVAFTLYTSLMSGKKMDLTNTFEKTDEVLKKLEWRKFGTGKLFSSKLRFQIKLDDLR